MPVMARENRSWSPGGQRAHISNLGRNPVLADMHSTGPMNIYPHDQRRVREEPSPQSHLATTRHPSELPRGRPLLVPQNRSCMNSGRDRASHPPPTGVQNNSVDSEAQLLPSYSLGAQEGSQTPPQGPAIFPMAIGLTSRTAASPTVDPATRQHSSVSCCTPGTMLDREKTQEQSPSKPQPSQSPPSSQGRKTKQSPSEVYVCLGEAGPCQGGDNRGQGPEAQPAQCVQVKGGHLGGALSAQVGVHSTRHFLVSVSLSPTTT